MAFLIGDGVAGVVRLICCFVLSRQFVFGIADGVFGRVDCVRHRLVMLRVPCPHDASMRSSINLTIKSAFNIFDEVPGLLPLCRRKVFVVIVSILFVPPVMHGFAVLGGVVGFPAVGGSVFMVCTILSVPPAFCAVGRRGICRPAVAVGVALSAGIPVGGRSIGASLCHLSVPNGIIGKLCRSVQFCPDGTEPFRPEENLTLHIKGVRVVQRSETMQLSYGRNRLYLIQPRGQHHICKKVVVVHQQRLKVCAAVQLIHQCSVINGHCLHSPLCPASVH